jgi:hypothetical protein
VPIILSTERPRCRLVYGGEAGASPLDYQVGRGCEAGLLGDCRSLMLVYAGLAWGWLACLPTLFLIWLAWMCRPNMMCMLCLICLLCMYMYTGAAQLPHPHHPSAGHHPRNIRAGRRQLDPVPAGGGAIHAGAPLQSRGELLPSGCRCLRNWFWLWVG